MTSLKEAMKRARSQIEQLEEQLKVRGAKFLVEWRHSITPPPSLSLLTLDPYSYSSTCTFPRIPPPPPLHPSPLLSLLNLQPSRSAQVEGETSLPDIPLTSRVMSPSIPPLSLDPSSHSSPCNPPLSPHASPLLSHLTFHHFFHF